MLCESQHLWLFSELPQYRQVWPFTQADWRRVQAAISLHDLSPISTALDINSLWEFFHRNLLSLMHRSIPSHLQLSYPSSHPRYSQSCGEEVALKQLAFSSWKINLTNGNLRSFHKACNKCMSTLRRARKHLSNLKSKLSNFSPSSKTWWHLVKTVSGVCSPSIPSLTSNRTTADCL